MPARYSDRSVASRRLRTLAATVMVSAGVSHVAVGQVLTTWATGGAGVGQWNDVLRWNNGIPNGPNFVAIVNGGSTQFTGPAISSGEAFSVLGVGVSENNFVNIDTGGQLTVSGGIAFSGIGLDLGALNIRGNVFTNGEAVLNVSGTTPIRSGGFGRPGFVNMMSSESGHARIRGSGTLDIGSGVTVAGGGDIGQNLIRVVNAGTILANGVGSSGIPQDMFIDVANDGVNAGFFNNGGTLLANGTAIVLSGGSGGSFDNANGRIIAGSTDVRLVFAADVRNGTLSSSGAGVIRVPNDNGSILTNVTNVGNIVIDNTAALNLGGTLANNGSVNINAVANGASIRVGNGTATLAGSGVVNLNSPNSSIARIPFSGNGTFVNNSTIQGQGQVGPGGINIVNNGLIQATTGTLTVAPLSNGTVSCINTGTMLANGGVLQISGPGNGFYDNTGGRIIAGATEVRLVSSADLRNGILSSSGTGLIRVANNDGVKLTNVTNLGNIVVDNTAVLDLSGTFTNHGSVNLNSTSNLADLRIGPTTVNLAGSGVINLNGDSARISASAFTSGGTVVNGTTIQGRGQIGTSNIFVVNNGLIQATTGPITFSPISTGPNTAGLINNGTLLANGGTITLSGTVNSFFNNAAGTISVAANGTLTTTNSADVRGGMVELDGRWNALSSTTAKITRFRGSGTLDVSNSALVKINAGGGTAGTSTTTSLSVSTNGRLDITDHAVAVDYTGASPLSTIRSQIASAYTAGTWGGAGITSSSATAAASTPDKTGIGYAEASQLFTSFPANFNGVAVDNTTVLIQYALYGDANLDKIVNITDFARLAAKFNQPANWIDGDFNYSGTADISDFSLLAANFNKSLPADLPRGAAVPEPVTITMLCGVLALQRRRK